jgi:hypothetical protein
MGEKGGFAPNWKADEKGLRRPSNGTLPEVIAEVFCGDADGPPGRLGIAAGVDSPHLARLNQPQYVLIANTELGAHLTDHQE